MRPNRVLALLASRRYAARALIQLPPNMRVIGVALDAEHREALDEAMGLGIRNEHALKWLISWREEWRTYPFLVVACELTEMGSAAGGLARDWDAALTLGQAAVALFNALATEAEPDISGPWVIHLTEPRARDFNRILDRMTSGR
jgi:hypothetical protein